MHDPSSADQTLIAENAALKRRIQDLERSDADRKRVEGTLRESEERLRAFLDNSAVIAWLKDEQGRHVFLSENYQRRFGVRQQDWISKTDFEVWPRGIAEVFRQNDLAVLASGKPSEVIEETQQPDGRSTWWLSSKFCLRGSTGKRYVGGLGVDITERKRAEEALRASEARHRTILQTAMDGFWRADREGRLLEVNETYCRMSQYSAQELVTMGIPDLEAVESAAGIAAHIQQVIVDGEGRFESRHRRKDETLFDVEVSAQSRPSDGGQFVCFLRDITEQKNAERTLTYVMAAVESARDAIGISDANGHHVYHNKAMSDLCGYATAEELEAAGGGAAVVKDPVVAAAMFDKILHGKSWVGELEMVTKSGRVFPAFEHADAILDGAGQLVGLMGIVTDITERKRAEQEKARLEAQLQQAQKMELVGRLAGGVAHEFNNQLTVILGLTDLLLNETGADPLWRESLLEIEKAGQRSAAVARQLLAFARRQTIAPRVLDLNETVGGMLPMLRRLIGEDIHLLWRPGESLWPVRLDPSQVDQILANLCINARDAIADVGTVTVETENTILDEAFCASHGGSVPGDHVRLAVGDNGSGMDQETLAHVFEPFFTTKGLSEGAGLGLSIVYGIVKQNAGYIGVWSEPGHGTTVTIYLPRHAVEAALAPRRERPIEPVRRGHETVMVVEDEPAVLKLITRVLDGAGYRVLPAGTPNEAIRLARERASEIHLLLTDVVMPEMNGRVLAQNLLALYPQIKRLFMSGYTADALAQRGILAGDVLFIQKPCSARTLAAKVRDALDAPS